MDQFVVAYLDDILIYSKTRAEHTKHIKQVLRKLQARGLRIKLKKCVFYQQRVDFLGFVVTTKGIEMEIGKVQTILDWPKLGNVKDV